MINTDNRFSWKALADSGQKMGSIRRYYWGGSFKLTNLLLKKIAREKNRKTLDVLDFGCSHGTCQLKEAEISINYFGYDSDPLNDHAKFHKIKEMDQMHFDVIVFSHVIEHMHLEEMISVMDWSREHADYIIILLPRIDYPFNGFWQTLDHKRPYDNEPFLCYLENIGWDVIKYFHVDHYVKTDPMIIKTHRFLFCCLKLVSPFMTFMVYAKNKKFIEA